MSEGWPTDAAALARGRAFLQAQRGRRVVLACDRDVDGLAAAVLTKRALARRGSHPTIVPIRKGETVFDAGFSARVAASSPEALVVLDTGSRAQAIGAGVPTLVVDHHQPSGHPPDATFVSAFGHEPVASTSVLAHALVPDDDLAWLAVLGGVADLGDELPWPHLRPVLAEMGRSAAREAVSLLNAARRAGDAYVEHAIVALAAAEDARSIAAGRVPGMRALEAARAFVQDELRRCGHAAPRTDGNLATVRIHSEAQIHPLLAVRWSRRLAPAIVLVANDGYLPGRINFAMRTAGGINMVDLLRGLPFASPEGEWGHGHPAATGGSVSPDDFERFLEALRRAATPRMRAAG